VLIAVKKAGIKRLVLTSSMLAMLVDAKGTLNINYVSWTNVHAKNASAYLKSKTLAEKSAWNFIAEQKRDAKLELFGVNPEPIYGPTLSRIILGESMAVFKNLITGEMRMLPEFSINISDVKDTTKIHVPALENDNTNSKRFLLAKEKPHEERELA
jgi:dihydroflavonol-4-reductase